MSTVGGESASIGARASGTPKLARPTKTDAATCLGLVLLVVVAKLPVLATPYYWDELVWIGFAQHLVDAPLWSVLPGLHTGFPFANRPPGLFLPVAGVFKLCGPSIWLSHLWIVAFAALGVSCTYLLGRLWFGTQAGLLAAALLFSNPLYFAQSGFFLADVPVAAMGVATVYLGQRARRVPYWLAAMGLLLLKETGAAVVFAFAVYRFAITPAGSLHARARRALLDGMPLLAIGSYYVWQWMVTGYFFVHFEKEYDFYRLDLESILSQLPRVHSWLVVTQFKWVPALLIALALVLRPSFRERRELLLALLVLVCSGYSFSALYFLPRYLLPVAPFFFIVAAGALVALIPYPRTAGVIGIGMVVLGIASMTTPRLVGNGENDMGHRRVIEVHREAARYIESRHAGRRVMAAWPLSAVLSRPELGYVTRPIAVRPFTAPRALYRLGENDLVAASVPSTRESLGFHARQRGLRRLRSFDDGRIRVTVYERPRSD